MHALIMDAFTACLHSLCVVWSHDMTNYPPPALPLTRVLIGRACKMDVELLASPVLPSLLQAHMVVTDWPKAQRPCY